MLIEGFQSRLSEPWLANLSQLDHRLKEYRSTLDEGYGCFHAREAWLEQHVPSDAFNAAGRMDLVAALREAALLGITLACGLEPPACRDFAARSLSTNR